MQQFYVDPPSVDWLMVLPITLVVCTGLVALIIEMLQPKRTNNPIVIASLVGLVAAAASVVWQFGMDPGHTLGGMVTRDNTGLVLQLVLIAICFVCILFSETYLRRKRIPFGEFYQLAVWATSGGMIMVSTDNLLMLFLGLEILSIALYVMAGMSRQESKSEESAIKYFLLGAFMSGFLLYGIAMIYGASGSVAYSAIGDVAASGAPLANTLAIFGVGLVLVAMFFKSAFVPFHQWTPDVYQGAPTNVTAFMAAGSKVAAIGALWRILDASIGFEQFWQPALFWIAVLTMTVANLVALLQKDVKRLLGYSSIGNAGYIAVALLAHFKDPEKIGPGTTVFYLASYAAMTLGAFAVISLTARGGKEGTRFEDLRGLSRRAPWLAVLLVVFVISLIGLPPTAGFFAKFFIFIDAIDAGYTSLAIVLAVNSIISIAYYLKIILAAVVEPETSERSTLGAPTPAISAAATLCAIGVFALAAIQAPMVEFVNKRPEPTVRPGTPIFGGSGSETPPPPTVKPLPGAMGVSGGGMGAATQREQQP